MGITVGACQLSAAEGDLMQDVAVTVVHTCLPCCHSSED